MTQFKAILASRAISKAVGAAIKAELPSLKKELTQVIKDQIEIAFDPINSPEVDSIINGRSIGSLKAELGLTGPTRKIESMKRSIVAQTRVLQEPAIGRKLARLTIEFTPDVEKMSNENWAFQANNGKNGPLDLPWFEWLALWGLRTPAGLKGWDSFYAAGTPAAKFSRSKTDTIMRKSKSRSWNVSIQFAGTRNNNFITRALNKRLISIRRQTDLSLKVYLNRVRRRLS